MPHRLAAPVTFTLVLLLLPLALTACGNGETVGGTTHDIPEALWAYAVSQIFIPHTPQDPGAAKQKIQKVRLEILEGLPFADAAKRYSEDPQSKELGGFIGFIRPNREERLHGALQALVPGELAGPVGTRDGFRLLLRHTFEEGRELEARSTIPAYGFLLPWEGSAKPADLSREEAEATAKDLRARIEAGKLTLEEAALPYLRPGDRRPTTLLGMVRNVRETKQFFDALAGVESGQFIPVQSFPGGFTVVRRGRLLRALVRHIVIQHRDSPSRPLNISRSREEAKALAERIAAEADRHGGNWADLVKRYHEETDTIETQGTLDTMTNGDLDPRLEAVLLATPSGEVALTVAESQVGFHILYRVR